MSHMSPKSSENLLFTWIGLTDIRAAQGALDGDVGPIGSAIRNRVFSKIILLSDHSKEVSEEYKDWLSLITSADISIYYFNLSGPTRFGEIYESAIRAVESEKRAIGSKEYQFTYHLSPGTPAMAAVWILLANTSHPAELIESSPEGGVQTVSLPFEISVDYLPHMSSKTNDELVRLTQGLPPEAPEFDHIVHRCKAMKKVVALARKLAAYDVPILILGESGTGKELFARAIHASSQRRSAPFVAVNCGAIPHELVEAEFFGYKKGAFTGAIQNKEGYLESADGGTLFLDEIGELPLAAQVKLLRALQERTVQKLGSTKLKKVNLRVIAATNRNLQEEVVKGAFREDLFHRLAVGVLMIPPLRERKGDMNPLIDHCLERINHELGKQPGWKHKKLSAGARKFLHQHPWPGNIRELFNTLSRAAIWTPDEMIRAEDLRQSILPLTNAGDDQAQILNRSIGNGLDLPGIMAHVARHYLKRALSQAQGNKTLAAKLVGLPSYQTFTNWMKKYGIVE